MSPTTAQVNGAHRATVRRMLMAFAALGLALFGLVGPSRPAGAAVDPVYTSGAPWPTPRW